MALVLMVIALFTPTVSVASDDLIKSDLPVYEETPEPDFEEMKYILAFRVEMLKTLIPMNSDLSIEDIEIKS